MPSRYEGVTINELANKMIAEGGAIVPSGQCSRFEIAHAGACHRFAMDEHGFGFVLRSKDWCAMADEGMAARLAQIAMAPRS